MNKKLIHIYISGTIERENPQGDVKNYQPLYKRIMSQKIEYYYFDITAPTSQIQKSILSLELPETVKEKLTYLAKCYNHEGAIHTSLVEWYNKWHRIMPWRVNTSVYGTWVSEIMLQQTQVITVINYYNRFMARFPTLFELAQAEESEVLLYWKGLGYYSRARNLHKCAQIVASSYQGVFPNTLKELKKLPGIGPYTSGAILSIGYNQKASAIDGNVTRILSRVYAYSADSKSKEAYSFFEAHLDKLLIGDYSKFNQALMDLGAMICKGKKPICSNCPLELLCKASQECLTETIPKVLKKPEKKIETYNAIIYSQNNEYFLEHRTSTTLLKNTWGLPLVEEDVSTYSYKLAPIKHVFTHKVWKITPYVIEYRGEHLPPGAFYKISAFSTLPIAKAFQKIIDQITEII